MSSSSITDDPATNDLPGAPTPVLSAGLLSRIHELNLDYLDLLTAEHEAGETKGQLQCLPHKLHAAVASLQPAARGLLAALPYTLYSLRFEDERFWRVTCDMSAAYASLGVRERYTSPRATGLLAPLCEVALLYAWHVATSNPLAARLVYAMPDATAQRLANAPLWHIKRLAADHGAILMPRWPTNPAFWPDLLHFAATNDSARLATAKLLGSQLIAAELDGRTGNGLQSPRLRVRKVQFEGRRPLSTR